MSQEYLNQYLSFKVDKEHYALDVASVREVLEYTEITKIPRMPSYMRGVINIRGMVVPIVDLRIKFQLPQKEPTVDTSIIVVELNINEETQLMGLMTDSVDAVLDIPPEEIQPPPSMGNSIDASLIKGMGKTDDRFLIILDLERLILQDEIQAIMDKTAV